MTKARPVRSRTAQRRKDRPGPDVELVLRVQGYRPTYSNFGPPPKLAYFVSVEDLRSIPQEIFR